MDIGILQCGHTPDGVREKQGDFADLFSRLLAGQGLTFQVWDVVDMVFPDDVNSAGGWLITGSKHGAYEDHPFIPPLEEFIRHAHNARKPMVGICFGHQIIAQALGGHVEKFSGGWAVGQRAYDFEELGSVRLNAWHQDQVIKVPPGARTIGRSAFCEHAALTYGDHILSIQPHPEITNPVLEDYLAVRGTDPRYDPAMIAQAKSALTQTGDERRFARKIADFLKAAHQ